MGIKIKINSRETRRRTSEVRLPEPDPAPDVPDLIPERGELPLPAVVDDERGAAVERGFTFVQHGGCGEHLHGLHAFRLRRNHSVGDVRDELKGILASWVGDESPVAARGLGDELAGRLRRREALPAPGQSAGCE